MRMILTLLCIALSTAAHGSAQAETVKEAGARIMQHLKKTGQCLNVMSNSATRVEACLTVTNGEETLRILAGFTVQVADRPIVICTAHFVFLPEHDSEMFKLSATITCPSDVAKSMPRPEVFAPQLFFAALQGLSAVLRKDERDA